MKLVKDTDDKNLVTKKVSDKEAEEAIRTIYHGWERTLKEKDC